MEKIEFEYEIELVKSNEWNMVVRLMIICDGNVTFKYGISAVEYVRQNRHLYTRKILDYIIWLKQTTDKMFLSDKI